MIISISKAYFLLYITSLYTNPLIISSTYVGWECEKYALLMHNTQVGTTHKYTLFGIVWYIWVH